MKCLNFGIERERCLSIEWVWSIRANAGCHEHGRSKFTLMNIQISKCDPYREKFLLTERDTLLYIGATFAEYYIRALLVLGNGRSPERLTYVYIYLQLAAAWQAPMVQFNVP